MLLQKEKNRKRIEEEQWMVGVEGQKEKMKVAQFRLRVGLGNAEHD